MDSEMDGVYEGLTAHDHRAAARRWLYLAARLRLNTWHAPYFKDVLRDYLNEARKRNMMARDLD